MKQLRILLHLEGVSLLVLLFVAMPLKYVAGYPVAVRIVGSLHGILFLSYLAGVVEIGLERRWSRGRIAVAMVASIVPFGSFALDRAWRRSLAVDAEADRARG